MSLLESSTQPVVLSRVYVLSLPNGAGEDAYYYRLAPRGGHPGVFTTREDAESYKALCAGDALHPIHQQLFLASLIASMGSAESRANLPQNSSVDKVEIHAWPAIGSSMASGFPCHLIQAYDRGELTSRELCAVDCERLAAWATLDNIRQKGMSARHRAWCEFAAGILNQSAAQDRERAGAPPLSIADIRYNYRDGAPPLLAVHEDLRTAALELADIMRNSPMISEV